MSRFIKNVIKLGSATAIAQVLGILLIPVITRLYSPSDYGISQIFISTVLIIGAVSCLCYHFAILLPKNDSEAAHIVILCFFLIVAISIIAGAVFWILSSWLVETLNAPAFSQYLILLPFGIFFHGFALVMSSWLSRRVRFGTVAVSKVASSATNKLVQIGFGLKSPSPLGLIAGSLANDASYCICMLRGMRSDLVFFKKFSFSEIKSLARRYRKFPMFSSGSILANAASVNVSSYLLAFYFSPIVVGLYAIAYTVVQLPVKLIADALGDVFFQKASEEKRKTGEIHNVVHQVHRRLISIGIFPFLVLIVIGEDLFSVFLGANWATAGLYAKILSPWIFIIFISSPLSSIFNVLERQGVSLIFNLAILASRIIALCIGGILGDPVTALILFSSTGVLFWGWMNIYILRSAGVSIKSAVLDILKFLLIGCAVIAPLVIVGFYFPGTIGLIIFGGVLAIVYYLIIVVKDDMLKQEVIRFFKTIRRD